jgi:acyl-CoA thioesterase FadM
MVHIDMDFMTEVTHPGIIGILPEVARIGGRSVTTKYEVHVLKDGKIGEAVARATCVNVFMYDGKPTRLPESLRDALRDV